MSWENARLNPNVYWPSEERERIIRCDDMDEIMDAICIKHTQADANTGGAVWRRRRREAKLFLQQLKDMRGGTK